MGEVELEGSVLVIKRIHVQLKLRAQESQRDTTNRVHSFFADQCPIYRTLKPAIQMSTELIFEVLRDAVQ